MAADEEDDYMSDKYLTESTDTKPSLLFNRTLKKQFEKETKHKQANDANRSKPKKVLEKEKREEGLQSALSADNKGFALLQKMGYKPGMAIGKKGIGTTEPIPITIKENRGGLGRDTQLKRKTEENKMILEQLRKKRAKLEQKNQELYRDQMSSKVAERQIMGDLRKSQVVCQQLDSEISVTQPKEPWFWVVTEKVKDEEDEETDSDSTDSESEDDEKPEPSFMLEYLTEYLRSKHRYCLWCGIKFEDDTDMQTNCPGNTSDDH